MNWKRFGSKGLWPCSGNWYLHGGTEENLDGRQDIWHPAQDLN